MNSEKNTKNMDHYLSINKKSWNKRTDFHLKSDFYQQEHFMKGNSSLKPIELELLGNIEGKSVLHLQCHFGQDTVSLSRMGAQVTGVDLSDNAIKNAKRIADELNVDTQFICCDIYDLPNHLDQEFDIVFTSYGTINWLPDLNQWAAIIARFLKPKGRFVFAEFHPVVWMFDDDFEKVGYNYFNDGPIVETESGTYADRSADIEEKFVCWNHSMSEVVNNLIKNGLAIQSLNEYDYSPYDCVNHLVEYEPGKYQIAHFGNKVPMVYAIEAINLTLDVE